MDAGRSTYPLLGRTASSEVSERGRSWTQDGALTHCWGGRRPARSASGDGHGRRTEHFPPVGEDGVQRGQRAGTVMDAGRSTYVLLGRTASSEVSERGRSWTQDGALTHCWGGRRPARSASGDGHGRRTEHLHTVGEDGVQRGQRAGTVMDAGRSTFPLLGRTASSEVSERGRSWTQDGALSTCWGGRRPARSAS